MTLVRAAARRQAQDLPLGLHVALAAAALVLALGAIVGAVQFWGDPRDAGPRAQVAITAGETEAPVLSLAEAAADEEDARLALEAEDPLLVPPPLEPAGPSAQAVPPPLAASGDPHGEVRISTLETPRPAAKPLPRAPLPGLFEPSPFGPLPMIAADGRRPSRAYARPPPPAGTKPRVAIVVGGLGFNADITQAAIEQLPPEVTLSFAPYAKDLQTWIARARADGHEVMLELPMEPYSATEDTGPDTLLADANAETNLRKLNTLMGKAAGYFGVTNYQGAKFAASQRAAGPVASALKNRGLVFLGNGVGPRSAFGQEAERSGLAFASVDRIVDVSRDPEAIDKQLLTLEALALQNGSALGSGFGFPVTIDQIELWTTKLSSRGYVLAPASAVMDARAKR